MASVVGLKHSSHQPVIGNTFGQLGIAAQILWKLVDKWIALPAGLRFALPDPLIEPSHDLREDLIIRGGLPADRRISINLIERKFVMNLLQPFVRVTPDFDFARRDDRLIQAGGDDQRVIVDDLRDGRVEKKGRATARLTA